MASTMLPKLRAIISVFPCHRFTLMLPQAPCPMLRRRRMACPRHLLPFKLHHWLESDKPLEPSGSMAIKKRKYKTHNCSEKCPDQMSEYSKNFVLHRIGISSANSRSPDEETRNTIEPVRRQKSNYWPDKTKTHECVEILIEINLIPLTYQEIASIYHNECNHKEASRKKY
jgi:hypothetical protein